jgi:hypothetical protein
MQRASSSSEPRPSWWRDGDDEVDASAMHAFALRQQQRST